MKIVIADDHALFSEGLKNLLQSRDYEVAATAKNGLEALELAKTLRPDVILMDIFMPECDGLEAAMLINAGFPEIKIVMLTSSENESDIFNAVKAGACGYFIKNFAGSDLFDLLQALAKDEIPVSPGLAGKILNELQSGKKSTNSKEKDSLTDRQLEVLSLVSQGCFYKEIAEQLGISERTVKYHVKSAIDKLHLQNRSQLINYATKANMIDIMEP